MVLSDKGRLILFLCFFLQMAAKSSSLSHVSFFFGVDDENKVDQSLIFFFLPAFCSAEWPAETEVFKDSIESFSIDLFMTEDEAEDVVYLESW